MELFRLHNATAFNLTGEVSLKSSKTGQKLEIAASHSNRTITFNANYDYGKDHFTQMSKLQLEPSVWIAYYVNLTKYVKVNAKNSLFISTEAYKNICFTFRT